MAFDRLAAAPLDLGRVFQAIRDCADLEFSASKNAPGELLWQEDRGKRWSWEREFTAGVKEANRRYCALLDEGREEEALQLRNMWKEESAFCWEAFRKAQDCFVRLDWHDQVLFPHQAVRQNLCHLEKAIACLEEGSGERALGMPV